MLPLREGVQISALRDMSDIDIHLTPQTLDAIPTYVECSSEQFGSMHTDATTQCTLLVT